MKKKLLAVMFGAVLVLGACGGGKTDKNAGEGETTAVDPEKVVQSSCVACHGGNLEGKSGPALTTIGATLSESEIHDIIVNGKNGMPPIKMSEEESNAVAKWLSEKK